MLNKTNFFAHLLMFNKFTNIMNPLLAFVIIFGVLNSLDFSYCDPSHLTNTPKIPEAYAPLTRHEVQAVFDYQQEQIDQLKKGLRFAQLESNLQFFLIVSFSLFFAIELAGAMAHGGI